jgi:hypothetical protein
MFKPPFSYWFNGFQEPWLGKNMKKTHPRHNLNSFRAIRSQPGNLYMGLFQQQKGWEEKPEKRRVKHQKIGWNQENQRLNLDLTQQNWEVPRHKMGLKQQEFNQIFWRKQ